MKLSDKVYDTLKWIVTIVLPALSALYWGLSGIWGWLYAEQVVGTVAVGSLRFWVLCWASARRV